MRGLIHSEYRDDCNNLIWQEDIHNDLTVDGANYILNSTFRGITTSQMYLGLIGKSDSAVAFTYPSRDQHMANIPLWSDTLYDQWSEFPDASGNRQPFLTSLATSDSIQVDNSSLITFTLGSLPSYTDPLINHLIYGIFMTNKQVYQDNTGVFFSYAAFRSAFIPQENYTLRLNYRYTF
jgi:hypothetical protein